MSIDNYTPERLYETTVDAEQLSLALIMLMDQKLDEDQLRFHFQPLLVKLNDDLQEISMFQRIIFRADQLSNQRLKIKSINN